MAMPAGIGARLRAAAQGLKSSVITCIKNAFSLLKIFCLWLKRLWLWVWEPYHFYISVFALVLPIGVSFYYAQEDIIRWAGLFLQILGIFTVWLGIEETRKLFGHPPFWEQARQRVRLWWQARPTSRRDATVQISPVSGTVAIGGIRPFVDASPDATIEQRLDALEKNLTRVRVDLAGFQDRTAEEFAKQTEALKQERQSRTTADQKLKDLLTATETGGLHITIAGAIYLISGVIMSTIPAELADCLSRR